MNFQGILHDVLYIATSERVDKYQDIILKHSKIIFKIFKTIQNKILEVANDIYC
jgi:hypothetical protein